MAWAVPVIHGLMYVANAVCFYQFILEEAIQSGVLGVYLIKKARRDGKAAAVLEELESKTIPALRDFNKYWAHLAPWAKWAFRDFALAGELSVAVAKAGVKQDAAPPIPKKYEKSIVEFTTHITRDPTPTYIGQQVTFSASFASTLNLLYPIPGLQAVWTVNGVEVKRETKEAPAHAHPETTEMTHKFEASDTYEIKCNIYNPAFSEDHPIARRNHAAGILPPMAAVEFTSPIQWQPIPTHVNKEVIFTVSFGCSMYYPHPTGQMEFDWSIDGVEVAKDKLTAPEKMEERETDMKARFNNPGEYEIKCVCTGEYLGKKHEIDTITHTVQILE